MEKSIESLRFVYRPVIYSETGGCWILIDSLADRAPVSMDYFISAFRWDRFTRFKAYEFLHLASLPLPLLFFVISPQHFISTHEQK